MTRTALEAEGLTAMKITKDHIGTAVKDEVTTWQSAQHRVINGLQYPYISGNFLKTVAWLNFGVDMTKTLYPGVSKVATAITEKYVVPLWILGQVQNGFQSLYDRIISHHNEMLKTKYETLRDEFKSMTDRTARSFLNSRYGRSIIDQIYIHWKNRDFRDSAEINSMCRNLIYHAGLVETDESKIRTKNQRGLGGLCKKIHKIYLGSDRGPGTNVMYFANSRQTSIGRHGTGRNWQRAKRKDDQDWIMANAWRMEVHHIDEPWTSKRPDRSYVTLIRGARRPETLAATFEGTRLPLVRAEKKMKQASGKKPSSAGRHVSRLSKAAADFWSSF